jgi:WD40 repeat protein
MAVLFFQNERLYVSGDDNKVAIYSLTDLTLEGILSRASAPVTCLSISSDGKLLASGGWYAHFLRTLSLMN